MGYFQLVILAFVSLFPVVNPVGTALIVNSLLGSLSFKERQDACFRIAFNCFVLCIVTCLLGSWILRLFGISLPIVRVAGGLMIANLGWRLLNSPDGTDNAKGSQESSAPKHSTQSLSDMLFYPLAFPMTTGAGTISVLLALSAKVHNPEIQSHVLNLSALAVAVFLMCLLVFVCYTYSESLTRRLGPRGNQVLNRLSAFIVLCVGMDVAYDGIKSLSF